MRHRLLSLVLLASAPAGLFWLASSALMPVASTAHAEEYEGEARGRRLVVVTAGLAKEELALVAGNPAASGRGDSLLMDTPRCRERNLDFLNRHEPEELWTVGEFAEGNAPYVERFESGVFDHLSNDQGLPDRFWLELFPQADNVVLVRDAPYRLLLQAAGLAAVMKAPLLIVGKDRRSRERVDRLLKAWQPGVLHIVGKNSADLVPALECRKVVLAGESAVRRLHVKCLRVHGVEAFVAANPDDVELGHAPLSPLTPWIAQRRRAVLLFTNARGDNLPDMIHDTRHDRNLARVEHLLLCADLRSIPMDRRDNPIPEGKDPFIEMEPLTPEGERPFSFAIGRLIHDDPGMVALWLARQEKFLQDAQAVCRPRKALIASNPTGSLPLLEMFSRNTAKELRNVGFETTARFGKEVRRKDMRKQLAEVDLFLWEGHHKTLIKDYGFAEWTEPLQPSLIFLQSCLALQDAKAQPLIDRGALSIVGSSTRIYSASGGAFALAYLNALMYEHQSQGAALRHAKNFLLAYALLKEKRLGENAPMMAANSRSSWSFTLWGDPTMRFPLPPRPEDALPPISHRVKGRTITIDLPPTAHDKAANTCYTAQMLPNARLAGLLKRDEEDDAQCLTPLIFIEVSLPNGPEGARPNLRSAIPQRNWTFLWDERRRAGYLLVLPRNKDRNELRFVVDWETRMANESSRAR